MVRSAISSGDLHESAGYGEEEIAFTLWATVHGMAILETTFGDSEDNSSPLHEQAIKRLLNGLSSAS